MKSLIPETIERFPWAGHMGLKSLPAVIEAIESKRSSLIFTNTRSQSEKWYSAILHAKLNGPEGLVSITGLWIVGKGRGLNGNWMQGIYTALFVPRVSI